MALPCIVCSKHLDDVFPEYEQDQNQPCYGLTFVTYGHYGSTSFDPMDGSTLELNVCEECLDKARKDNKILYRPFQTDIDYIEDPFV